MKIQHNCIVQKVYKNPDTEKWTVVAARIDPRGETKYIGFKGKPKVRVGQVLCKGEEI